MLYETIEAFRLPVDAADPKEPYGFYRWCDGRPAAETLAAINSFAAHRGLSEVSARELRSYMLTSGLMREYGDLYVMIWGADERPGHGLPSC